MKPYTPNEIQVALAHWSETLDAMLSARYGRKKIGHFISVFPFSNKASISWISNARVESIAGMLIGLGNHLAKDKSAIIKPSSDEIGHFG